MSACSEEGDDWEIQVQDSILEKCADNNEILSISVEKNSKEVTFLGYIATFIIIFIVYLTVPSLF